MRNNGSLSIDIQELESIIAQIDETPESTFSSEVSVPFGELESILLEHQQVSSELRSLNSRAEYLKKKVQNKLDKKFSNNCIRNMDQLISQSDTILASKLDTSEILELERIFNQLGSLNNVLVPIDMASSIEKID